MATPAGLVDKKTFFEKCIVLANDNDTFYEDECPFCREPYDADHIAVKILPCNHVFGLNCLLEVIEKSPTGDHCMICQSPLFWTKHSWSVGIDIVETVVLFVFWAWVLIPEWIRGLLFELWREWVFVLQIWGGRPVLALAILLLDMVFSPRMQIIVDLNILSFHILGLDALLYLMSRFVFLAVKIGLQPLLMTVFELPILPPVGIFDAPPTRPDMLGWLAGRSLSKATCSLAGIGFAWKFVHTMCGILFFKLLVDATVADRRYRWLVIGVFVIAGLMDTLLHGHILATGCTK